MPLVRPFRAHTYRYGPGADISSLVAPPYDVIASPQREALIGRDPHNVVALELPDGSLDPAVPGNRYENGRATWERWTAEGIITHDESPAIYVLEQSWTHDGVPTRRRALIAAVRLHPFPDGVVLPHERTLPKALSDRFELLRATRVNLSQVFGLFSDPAGDTEAALDSAMAEDAMFVATDADGVVSRVWAIRDAGTIEAVSSAIGMGPIYIADGHHRYTTALAHRDECRAADAASGRTPHEPAYDYVMMALVNMDGPDLHVLPTHRAVRAEDGFSAPAFWESMRAHFDLTAAPAYTESLLGSLERTAFLVRAGGETRLAVLKPGVDPAEVIGGEHSDAWKRLDVAVLQELILRPLFGVSADEPASLERLSFLKDAEAALADSDADAVFVMAPTRMDQLREVAQSGETMPQKSTYFYPKLLSGLLFRSLES